MTRCHPLRAKELEACKTSIASQVCDDYEHVLIPDLTEKGCGRLEANQLFATFKGNPKIKARYLMVLDDDDMLIDDDFVGILKAIVEKQPYDLVIFKGWHFHHGVLPSPDMWRRPIQLAKIASFCMAVERDLWFRYIIRFGLKARGGDFEFMRAVYKEAKSIYWLDRKVARTQRESW